MQTNDIAGRVFNIVSKFADENEYEIVDVEYVKEGPNWYLRVYADKEGGVNIDDCEIISRWLEKKLEEDDFIDHAYILEVSSPGIDRILKRDYEYTKYKGRLVDIKLYKPLNGSKEIQGYLLGLENGEIKIELSDGSIMAINKKETAVCRLAVVF